MRRVLAIIVLLFSLSSIGCAKHLMIKLDPPAYPPMHCIKVNADGSLSPEMVKKVEENMLRLQELNDILYLCPCYNQQN